MRERSEDCRNVMVAVADDFTGAAEIAGIGLRYDLKLELQTEPDFDCDVELLVLDLNSRSSTAEAAKKKMVNLSRQLKLFNPTFIYKKTDSVLRGHVLAELETLMIGLEKDKALLVPANPSMGKTIAKGIYYIHGRKLHETEFAHDPEYPAVTSDVQELLGQSQLFGITVSGTENSLPTSGIVLGEAETASDLAIWAAGLGPDTMAAGGGDFFSTILEATFSPRIQTGARAEMAFADKPQLYVLGSSSENSRRAVSVLRKRGIPVCPLPGSPSHDNALNEACLTLWIKETEEALRQYGLALVVVDQPLQRSNGLPARLAELTARLVKHIDRHFDLQGFVIEGGTTASYVLRQLGWEKFEPLKELAPGIIMSRVKATNRFVITKVGSYPWPEELLPSA